MEGGILAMALAGSFAAGVINTLAGNGSAITLTFLTEVLGLPGNMANGTNRLGIFSQTVMGSWVFFREGRLDLRASRSYVLLTLLGAVPGVWLALHISNDGFRQVFGVLLVLMLLVILVKPERWLSATPRHAALRPALLVPALLLLGFYGGFIQMGMGIFFLAVMVLGAGQDLIRANAVKGLVVALFTLMAILIFHWKGMIDWKIGLVLASGQALGGFLTARYASRYPGARVWAYRLLVIVVVGSILRIFFL